MRFHWFANSVDNNISVNDLKYFIAHLDSCGYYSVLFTYHNQMPDMFLKLAHIRNNTKIKFMVAMRTRSISPEYFSMLCSSFSQIDPGGLIVNILHGSPGPEESQNGIIDHDKFFNTRDGVVSYTKKFLELVKNNNLFNNSNTEIVVSGKQKDTVILASDYADYWATDYSGLLNKKYFRGSKIIVALDLIILKDGESKESYSEKHYEYEPSNLKVLFENEVVQFIKDLKDSGVTDLMLSSTTRQNENKIHEFVKKYHKEFDSEH